MPRAVAIPPRDAATIVYDRGMQELLDGFAVSTLIASMLILVSVVFGLVTSRKGLPLLAVFLGIGMLAGENGPGGIVFNDHRLAFWVGNIALGVILLDGGLRTSDADFKRGIGPATVLGTIGVLLTCALTALGALLLLAIPLATALLFGAIVASTDAAAVFSLIKGTGVELRERIGATLEIESGVNDPMAVFLTVAAITFLTVAPAGAEGPDARTAAALLGSVLQQAGLGALFGGAGALAFAAMTRALRIDSFHNHGLNALLVISAGMAIFGLSTWLGGSGFLSVYLFGVVTRQRLQKFVRTIVPALDGLAWLFQASMFLLLGLLATPADVVDYALPGIALALWLILVARPLAVLPCLAPFGFTLRESLFISWVGLRGAVPIILAVYPIMAGVDPQRLMLNLAFMIVLASLLIQGSTLALAARRLGVTADNPHR